MFARQKVLAESRSVITPHPNLPLKGGGDKRSGDRI
jgi:hypothetical protein